jgi:hypothetical protein
MRGFVTSCGRRVLGKTAEKEDIEDRRVLSAALAVQYVPSVVCFRDAIDGMDQVYLARGLLPRLVQFVGTDNDLRRDAL